MKVAVTNPAIHSSDKVTVFSHEANDQVVSSGGISGPGAVLQFEKYYLNFFAESFNHWAPVKKLGICFLPYMSFNKIK